MYFNNKNNTNIDNKFEKKNILSKLLNFINKYKIIIIVSILLIIAIIVILSISNNNVSLNKNTYYLELSGNEEITLYSGSDYIEPGYNAYNSKKENINSEVKINSNIDVDTPGEYTITYSIGEITKTRKITIIKKPTEYTYIYLKTINNNVNVYIKVGEKYIEPGYMVFSSTGKNLTNEVTITGSVNTSKKGTYKLVYSLVDSNGVTVSATRTVIVMDSEINLSLSTNEYTNKDITINAQVMDNYFDYMILPDKSKVTKKNTSYKITENGTYTFTVYNKKGTKKETSIKVSNIDKTSPTGTCNGSYGDGASTININASDNIGIEKYVINNKDYTNNKITINNELEKINITIYDKAGNTTSINCSLTTTYDKPIEASGNKVIHNVSTKTLKVWVEEYSTYYVSHIWAINPYKQFKSAVPNNFGNELLTSNTLLKNDVEKRNYQNKVAIAVNASGIVLNGVWDSQYYSANNAWNKTSVSPIVIVDGKILRDFSSGKIPSSKHITYGLKKDGNLEYYKYVTGSNIQSNINTSKKIINDGVLYTFAFNPVLVENGKVSSKDTSPNIRQGICQIDKNNFVFITNKANRSTGFSFKTLGEYMVSLGCKTGFNIDGGGSASLLLKDSNNNITTIAPSSRAIADIIYFHEQ